MTEGTERMETAAERARNIARRFFRHENAVLIIVLIVLIATLSIITKGITSTPVNLRNVIIQTHARVGMDMVRRMKQLIEIVGFEPETNELISNTVYEWDQASDKFVFKGHSFLFDKIMEMKNLTHEELMQEFERRVDIIKYMVMKDMSDHRDIWDLIRGYYKDPVTISERVRWDLYPGGRVVTAAEVPEGGEVVG